MDEKEKEFCKLFDGYHVLHHIKKILKPIKNCPKNNLPNLYILDTSKICIYF